jgi:succinate dehydrogenase / fumarate reductase flavoprotein subunit
MYEKITDENPYRTPMRIFPAVHYTMGGLWVDYNLMGTVPGLFVLGEANFSDHGANRLGASALMQGLADGYFVAPYTVGNYFGSEKFEKVSTDHEAFKEAKNSVEQVQNKFLSNKGTRSPEEFHRELGKIMWDQCGMSRTESGLKKAIQDINSLKDRYYQDVRVMGEPNALNPELEKAGRVGDFIELAGLMCRDALERNESCGGHFREEYQTPDNEAKRDDDNFCHVAAWEYQGQSSQALRHVENLKFENIKLAQRNYK